LKRQDFDKQTSLARGKNIKTRYNLANVSTVAAEEAACLRTYALG